ncbi:MAG: biopolymer transporter ExbD [Paracoccaceae bacterium]|uniref:biopolymer transporter ExbD n=1 Tax=Seohaeicola saemankumensis TaxID=481181 RepID=UPI001E456DDD|nr:biopolymer transporter ExbD [Seohaeicola saemankumensis]
MASPTMLKRCLPVRRRALSMTSLIDVIFLLLLFFMLSTTFTRTAELPLVAGARGAGTAQTVPVFLRLAPETLTVNGQSALLDQVAAQILALGQDQPQVLVSLAPHVSAQRLADLLVRLRSTSGMRVQVLG